MLTQVALLDELLNAHAHALGRDFTAYRNHAYRVLNLCAAQGAGSAAQLEKVAIATAFHDIGIWTAGTFDYLGPSVALARGYLTPGQRADWVPEIEAMIGEHHKLRSYRGQHAGLVEPFRRADWTDVSLGLWRFGTRYGFVRELFAAFPDAGFHGRLVQLSIRQLLRHGNPFPMLRW
ncbi:MAG: hypothetical protein QM778_06915 [Myxococcales bacterium]